MPVAAKPAAAHAEPARQDEPAAADAPAVDAKNPVSGGSVPQEVPKAEAKGTLAEAAPDADSKDKPSARVMRLGSTLYNQDNTARVQKEVEGRVMSDPSVVDPEGAQKLAKDRLKAEWNALPGDDPAKSELIAQAVTAFENGTLGVPPPLAAWQRYSEQHMEGAMERVKVDCAAGKLPKLLRAAVRQQLAAEWAALPLSDPSKQAFLDQVRARDRAAAEAAAQKTTERDASGRVFRGLCARCGERVDTDETRARDSAGHYVHRRCVVGGRRKVLGRCGGCGFQVHEDESRIEGGAQGPLLHVRCAHKARALREQTANRLRGDIWVREEPHAGPRGPVQALLKAVCPGQAGAAIETLWAEGKASMLAAWAHPALVSWGSGADPLSASRPEPRTLVGVAAVRLRKGPEPAELGWVEVVLFCPSERADRLDPAQEDTARAAVCELLLGAVAAFSEKHDAGQRVATILPAFTPEWAPAFEPWPSASEELLARWQGSLPEQMLWDIAEDHSNLALWTGAVQLPAPSIEEHESQQTDDETVERPAPKRPRKEQSAPKGTPAGPAAPAEEGAKKAKPAGPKKNQGVPQPAKASAPVPPAKKSSTAAAPPAKKSSAAAAPAAKKAGAASKQRQGPAAAAAAAAAPVPSQQVQSSPMGSQPSAPAPSVAEAQVSTLSQEQQEAVVEAMAQKLAAEFLSGAVQLPAALPPAAAGPQQGAPAPPAPAGASTPAPGSAPKRASKKGPDAKKAPAGERRDPMLGLAVYSSAHRARVLGAVQGEKAAGSYKGAEKEGAEVQSRLRAEWKALPMDSAERKSCIEQAEAARQARAERAEAKREGAASGAAPPPAKGEKRPRKAGGEPRSKRPTKAPGVPTAVAPAAAAAPQLPPPEEAAPAADPLQGVAQPDPAEKSPSPVRPEPAPEAEDTAEAAPEVAAQEEPDESTDLIDRLKRMLAGPTTAGGDLERLAAIAAVRGVIKYRPGHWLARTEKKLSEISDQAEQDLAERHGFHSLDSVRLPITVTDDKGWTEIIQTHFCDKDEGDDGEDSLQSLAMVLSEVLGSDDLSNWVWQQVELATGEGDAAPDAGVEEAEISVDGDEIVQESSG